MHGTILRQVRLVMAQTAIRSECDAELLGRFAERRDEAAFAELVRRHGRTVWAVCRNVLGQDHDAEDAYPATFLILAQKAGQGRERGAVAAWLHGVARRVAMSTRRGSHRRKKYEQGSGSAEKAAGIPASIEASFREVRAIIDEELARLPTSLRAAFVLCCLEGKTAAEAARQLGCTEGSVTVSLCRARKQLAGRLAARGVSLAVALGAASVFSAGAGAAVPTGLARTTIEFVTNFVSGNPAGAAASAVAALAERSVTIMTLTKLKATLGLAVLAIVGIGIGIGSGVGRQAGAQPPGLRLRATAPPVAGMQEKKRPPADAFGDPLPQGARTPRNPPTNPHEVRLDRLLLPGRKDAGLGRLLGGGGLSVGRDHGRFGGATHHQRRRMFGDLRARWSNHRRRRAKAAEGGDPDLEARRTRTRPAVRRG